MKLIGKLADNVSKAKNAAEAINIIRDAGIELSDEELAAITGGIFVHRGMKYQDGASTRDWNTMLFRCSKCGKIYAYCEGLTGCECGASLSDIIQQPLNKVPGGTYY